MIEIRSAGPADLATAVAWLDGEGLPSSDLSTKHMQSFLMAVRGGEPVGMIGIEAYPDCGLLRSLFVAESGRGTGLGAQLVAALEQKAAAAGLPALWLLTIDAENYFTRLGFETAERGEAPESVQQSAEFSSLCPGDAVLMWKSLADD